MGCHKWHTETQPTPVLTSPPAVSSQNCWSIWVSQHRVTKVAFSSPKEQQSMETRESKKAMQSSQKTPNRRQGMAAPSLAQGPTLRRAGILVCSLTLSGASTGSQEMILHFYCKQPLCPPVLPSRSAFHTGATQTSSVPVQRTPEQERSYPSQSIELISRSICLSKSPPTVVSPELAAHGAGRRLPAARGCAGYGRASQSPADVRHCTPSYDPSPNRKRSSEKPHSFPAAESSS